MPDDAPAAPVAAPVAAPAETQNQPVPGYSGPPSAEKQAALLRAWGGVPVETPVVAEPVVRPVAVAPEADVPAAEPVAETPVEPAATPAVPAETPVAGVTAGSAATPAATPVTAAPVVVPPEVEKFKKWEGLIAEAEAAGHADFADLQRKTAQANQEAAVKQADADFYATANADLAAFEKALTDKDPFITDDVKAFQIEARKQQWLTRKAQIDLDTAKTQLQAEQKAFAEERAERTHQAEQDEALRVLTAGEKPILRSPTPRVEALLKNFAAKDMAAVGEIFNEWHNALVEDDVAKRVTTKAVQSKAIPPEGGRSDPAVPAKQADNANDMNWQQALAASLKKNSRVYA